MARLMASGIGTSGDERREAQKGGEMDGNVGHQDEQHCLGGGYGRKAEHWRASSGRKRARRYTAEGDRSGRGQATPWAETDSIVTREIGSRTRQASEARPTAARKRELIWEKWSLEERWRDGASSKLGLSQKDRKGRRNVKVNDPGSPLELRASGLH
nr:hypothetical protein Iba_chr02dCG13970 [Ipomoea batatas]